MAVISYNILYKHNNTIPIIARLGVIGGVWHTNYTNTSLYIYNTDLVLLHYFLFPIVFSSETNKSRLETVSE